MTLLPSAKRGWQVCAGCFHESLQTTQERFGTMRLYEGQEGAQVLRGPQARLCVQQALS